MVKPNEYVDRMAAGHGSAPQRTGDLIRQSTTSAAPTAERPKRAWYSTAITDFLKTESDTIVGRLATNSEFALLPTQKDAWLAQIDLLQSHLIGLTGSLFLEFNIPRMGRRIDAALSSLRSNLRLARLYLNVRQWIRFGIMRWT